MKRRSMVLGIGALATGSGTVFSSAALSNTAVNNSGNLEVLSVGNLNAIGGSDPNGNFDYDDNVDSISNPSNLPAAYVNGSTQGSDLEVSVVTRNSSGNTDTFENLLRVVNNGTTDVNVGIGFNSFGGDVGGTISKAEVKNAYEFESNPGESTSGVQGSAQVIAPNENNDDDEPLNYHLVPAGETLAIDLNVTLSGTLVSQINSARSGSVTPSFDGNNVGDGVTLVDEILIGTESSST